MTGSGLENIDDIDAQILRILANDPRMPYQDIANELAEVGYEMSGEGIRYRVSKLMEATTAFFLLDPERTSWEREIVRIAARATDGPGDKTEMFERISEMPFWHVTMGIGTYDVYAVAMAPSLSDIESLLTTVRELDCVDTVDHIVVTERSSDLDDYYRAGEDEDE